MKNIILILMMAVLAEAATDSVLNIKINRLEELLSGNTEQIEKLQNEINLCKKESSYYFKNEVLKLNEEALSFRITIVTVLVSVLGILIMFLGIVVPIIGFKKFDKLEQEANRKIDDYIKIAENYLNIINHKREKASEVLQSIEVIENSIKNKAEEVNKLDNMVNIEKETINTEHEVKNYPKHNNFDKDLDYAEEQYSKGYYEEALKSYENIIKKYKPTKESSIYSNMAYIFVEKAEKSKDEGEKKSLLNRARDNYEKTLELKPENIYVYKNLSGVLIRLANHETEKNYKLKLLKEAEDAILKIENSNDKVFSLVYIYLQKYRLTEDQKDKNKLFDYIEEALENDEVKVNFKQIEQALEDDLVLKKLKEEDRYKKLKKHSLRPITF